MATFDKSAQNLGCPNENSETTIISPTSPKNDGIAFGFKRFQLLNMFGANLEIWYFFSHFEAVFPLAPTASAMCGANGQK